MRSPKQQAPPPGASTKVQKNSLIPKDVLVVEDNLIIALDTQDMLEENGVEDVHVASNVSDALELIETTELGFAVLDVKLGTTNSLAVAQELAARGIPFVLATGYGIEDDVLQGFPESKIIKKPYTSESLLQTIVKVLR